MNQFAKQATRLREVLVQTHQDKLEQLEQKLCSSPDPPPMSDICNSLFLSGGKRLRPLMTFVVGSAFHLEQNASVLLAQAMELTHGATLLHDDVIDEADQRRGQPSARTQWSNTMSILGGDFLLIRALDAIAQLNHNQLATAHRQTMHQLVLAEVRQHLAKQQKDISAQGYLQIAAGKTGSLFGFCCAAPALFRNDLVSADLLDTFGQKFGVAFQIADDLRDILAADPTKQGCMDLKDGVLSLPLRLAAEQNQQLRDAIFQLMAQTPSPEQLQTVTARILATQAIAASAAIGQQYITEAIASLEGLQVQLPLLDQIAHWLLAQIESMEKFDRPQECTVPAKPKPQLIHSGESR